MCSAPGRRRPPRTSGLPGDLDEVAAGVVEHGRGHRAHVEGLLGEAYAEAAHSFVLGLDVVDGEWGVRDAVDTSASLKGSTAARCLLRVGILAGGAGGGVQ